jgi:hypothetical protein
MSILTDIRTAASAYARIMTKHPAKVTVPELKVSISLVD